MKVALVYDRVNKWGGAERVLLALHKIFPKAPLYTSVYEPVKTSWASVFTIHTSLLQKFSFTRTHHEYFGTFMPFLFERFNFDTYDLVISITSEAAKGIITRGKTKHICICLTPTRYLWSGFDVYFANPLLRMIALPATAYLRWWDKNAAKRPDVYIAISQEVQRRIKEYYKQDSIVIYPPITLKNYKVRPSKEKGYFLVVSRLVSYKRIDLAIKACNTLQVPLKIIGTGSEEAYLRSIAGKTVEFLGNLTDEEVVQYYMHSAALLFPGLEDLGLTILEAQKLGKPVIAFKGGGALETITEGKTGTFFFPQTELALTKKLQYLLKSRKIIIGQTKSYYTKFCHERKEQFSEDTFVKNIQAFLSEYL
jgi:glycosyltransferase involved in cell wall biosynthesis